jgi:branched-chain amino acid transport system permease protein
MGTMDPPVDEGPWRDREPEARAHFEASVRQRLAELVDAALIEEHRRSPIGTHTPALARVLAYLRQAPVAAKLVLHAVEPRRRWTVLRLSGVPGVAHERIDDRVFDDRAEAEHAVFLARLAALGALPPDAET